MYMDVLGIVENVSHEGLLIIRGDAVPDHGSIVYGADKKRIGKVKRVFGPVERPYISVIPSDKAVLENISGKNVYFERGVHHGKNKRRN